MSIVGKSIWLKAVQFVGSSSVVAMAAIAGLSSAALVVVALNPVSKVLEAGTVKFEKTVRPEAVKTADAALKSLPEFVKVGLGLPVAIACLGAHVVVIDSVFPAKSMLLGFDPFRSISKRHAIE